ncbi:MAG: hypothetical protein K6G75_00685 [Lachnospiraceae bacterium]|nr:hypothetical protein [Lachnospiraceae bacterium]
MPFGQSRGGRPGVGHRIPGARMPKPAKPMSGFSSTPFRPTVSSSPISPINININNGPKIHRSRGGGGGGLLGSLVGSAVSAGVGVASAAIVNKMHENSQIKLAEKQAEQQAEIARQQAEQQAELARQQAEYQVEIERLKAQQEETKRDVIQDKRYYANCPYCMGVNNGAKFCQYCGSSLAYYDEDEDDGQKEVNNA